MLKNATIADGEALATIQNDDIPAILSISDVMIDEGNSRLTSFVFLVSLDRPAEDTITFDYTTQDVSALVSDSDYNPINGKITMLPLEKTKNIIVRVLGDDKYENKDTFNLVLSNLVGATFNANDSIGSGIIDNDDPKPIISIAEQNPISANESNPGETNTIRFALTLSNRTIETVTVDYRTEDKTAKTSDNDYIRAAGIVTFNPEVTVQTVDVTTTGDNKFEADQTFDFVISSKPTNAQVIDSSATATILNDDTKPSVTINDTSIIEGNSGSSILVFTVTLSHKSDEVITLNYRTRDNSAKINDNDYNVINASTLTFLPEQTVKTFNVPVNPDRKHEEDDQLEVALSNNSGISFFQREQALGTIINDDPEPVVNLTVDKRLIKEIGGEVAVFTMTTDRKSSKTVTVPITVTSTNGAVNTSDYNVIPGRNAPSTFRIVLPADDTLGTLNITAVNDIQYDLEIMKLLS